MTNLRQVRVDRISVLHFELSERKSEAVKNNENNSPLAASFVVEPVDHRK